MKFANRTKKKLGIDITPLIDVVFILLIFFMVSTTFMAQIPVKLPESSQKPSPTQPESLEVTIDQQGHIFVEGQATSLNLLGPLLAKKMGGLKEPNLIVHADGRVRHQMVVNVMDRAQRVGIRRISIATLPQ